MDSPAVIKNFDVFKYFSLCLLSGFKLTMMDKFCFQTVEKTFSNGIIPTIAFSTHGLNKVVILDDYPVTFGCILASSVTMALCVSLVDGGFFKF